MERRSFLKFLLSTPLAAVIDYEKLLWVPKPIITVPEMSLYGIDWGLNDSTIGTWMGIRRSTYPQFTSSWMHPAQGECYKEILAMVDKLKAEQNKLCQII